MRKHTHLLVGMVAVAALVLPAASLAQSDCGDLNNDGSTTQLDLIRLTQCSLGGGTCPAVSPGPLCGTGSLGDCGDVFADGNTTTGLTADVSALNNQLSGNPTLYDACTGPGAAIACGGGTVTIPHNTVISSNTTWPAGCRVELSGTVTVEGDGTVLAIEPGGFVCGINDPAEPAALVITPGNRIDARGTAADPIVFTACAAPGSDPFSTGTRQGAWGGVLVLGRGPVNGPGCTATAEGLEEFVFGGCVDNDHSGIVSFASVKFGGINFTANNELNNFTMNGLGNSTQFNFIHAHSGNDDNHEWFGGNSNHTNFLATSGGDDNADFQLGFTGSVQNYVVLQDSRTADPGSDSRGIEGDNSEFDNEASPRSDPDFCNMTIVGADDQAPAATNDGSDSGILLRRGTRAQIMNVLVQDFRDSGFEIRDVSTTQQACIDNDDDGVPESLTGDLLVQNSLFCDNGSSGPGSIGTEHAKSGGNQEDECATTSDCVGPGDPAACCTGAGTGCSATPVDPDCECTTPEAYALMVASHDVAPADGATSAECTAAAGDIVSSVFPTTLDAAVNSACTGVQTPYECCSGAGTGFCTTMPDFRPTVAIASVSAGDCTDINPLFTDTGYVGGVDPAGTYVASGTGQQVDWITFPWAQFNIE